MRVNKSTKGFVISLALHSLLLLPFAHWATQEDGLGKTAGPMAASGNAGAVNLASLQMFTEPEKPKPQPKKKGVGKKKKVVKKKITKKAKPQVAATGAKKSGENRLGGEQGTAGKMALAAIRTQLKKGLIYPDSARSRGMEGKVMMSFALSKTGELSEIRIKNGSGYVLLDRAAMLTLKRIRLALQLDKPLKITIPILFALR